MADYEEDELEDTSPPAFVLVPLNSAARKATEHVKNKYYLYAFDSNSGAIGLWVDFSDPEKQVYTLGRNETDIYLPEMRSQRGASRISDLQATFEVVQDTGAVILYDYSEHKNTEPFAPSHSSSAAHAGVTVKFRGTRSVLVARGINSRIAFGDDMWYQFEIQWRSDGMYALDKTSPYVVGPGNSKSKKYVQVGRVGGGAYGTVFKVIDVSNGSYMAVKKFHNLSGKNLDFATREVANLFRINKDNSIRHEHILQIFDYAGGEKDWGEIFMPLMDGNLKTLVEEAADPDVSSIADAVLGQMLLALDCIASHDIVHRDIKPENILWQLNGNGGYHFCLGDFGLSNDPKLARTVAGTEPFMAPEVFHRQPQTTKVDIWSLFATVVWVQNTDGFRDDCSQSSAPNIHRWLVRLSRLPEYAPIRRMARLVPKHRPSASRQLAILAEGEDEDEYDEAGYDEQFEGDPVGDLGVHFGRGMNLNDGGGYGGGSSGSTITPELPYYEPYASRLMEDYHYGTQAGSSSGRGYQPAPMSEEVPQRPRYPQAYVAIYGEEPYAPHDGGDDDPAAGPNQWSTQKGPAKNKTVYRERRDRDSRWK